MTDLLNEHPLLWFPLIYTAWDIVEYGIAAGRGRYRETSVGIGLAVAWQVLLFNALLNLGGMDTWQHKVILVYLVLNVVILISSMVGGKRSMDFDIGGAIFTTILSLLFLWAWFAGV